MKSVNIAALRQVRPILIEKGEIVSCTQCRVASARWEIGQDFKLASHFVCSHCFLYALAPLREQRESIDELVLNIEAAMRSRFPRDDEGCLVEVKDCDRVVFGLVAAQRYEVSRGLT